MSMQTIARGFEAMLWTVVCVKIEEKAQEMGIEHSKYKNEYLTYGSDLAFSWIPTTKAFVFSSKLY